ncbi:MAG: acyl carrier protein [Clostridia bacterium]|nr:acyl carrier protein [Clostridia bacterium]
MIQKDIDNRFNSIIKGLIKVQDENSLPYQTFQDLNINSIAFVQLVVMCEQEFDIVFENDMLLMEKYPTMEVFINYIKAKSS